MKTKMIFTTLCTLFLLLGGMGCEDDNEILPTYQAKGKVIFKTNACEGWGVYIEVENPKGIGGSGTFKSVWNREKTWNYTNAIGVPWFNKIGLSEELMEEGTWLHFEYREIDNSTSDSTLFFYNGFCLANQGPPSGVPYYKITKIIEHKYKK